MAACVEQDFFDLLEREIKHALISEFERNGMLIDISSDNDSDDCDVTLDHLR
jgi:hypothetical protein